MIAIMLIGLAIASVGWGLVQILPTPGEKEPLWKFTPIILYALGWLIAVAAVVILAWKNLP